MILPLLLAAAGAVYQDQFSQPLEVAQPIRLELTPTIDGAMDPEEWDPFGPQTFLQWEPGKIYVAGQMPAGKDLVLSIDGKGDGWLVGRDNLEFRVSVKDGKPVVTVRELDATVVKQPVWREHPELEAASSAAVSTSGDQTNIEAVFSDAGMRILPQKPKDMSLRVDTVDAGADLPAYLPRICAHVRFDDQRTAALPKGMQEKVQTDRRTVIPGDDIKLRLNFNGTNEMGAKSIEMHTLGNGEQWANKMQVIFPSFDKKGRAFVDYTTRIDPAATVGWRILRGTVSFNNGPDAIVETSYRVAPFMEFRLNRSDISQLPSDNVLRMDFVQQMYTRQSTHGTVNFEVPQGWTITRGDGQSFSLLGNQSARAGSFEVKVPADAHGTFPIKFTGKTENQTVTQTCYLTIR